MWKRWIYAICINTYEHLLIIILQNGEVYLSVCLLFLKMYWWCSRWSILNTDIVSCIMNSQWIHRFSSTPMNTYLLLFFKMVKYTCQFVCYYWKCIDDVQDDQFWIQTLYHVSWIHSEFIVFHHSSFTVICYYSRKISILDNILNFELAINEYFCCQRIVVAARLLFRNWF